MMNPQGGGGGGGHNHGDSESSPNKPMPGMASMERLSVPADFQQSMEKIFAAYLKVSAALVEGKLESAESSFAHLGNLVGAVPESALENKAKDEWKSVSRSIQNAVVLASTSKDLKELRSSFSERTTAVVHAKHRFGHTGGTLYETFCPMALAGAGASWLQSTKEVKNPYFGEAMLACGEVRQEFKAVTPTAPSPKAEKAPPVVDTPVDTALSPASVLTEFYTHYLPVGTALSEDAPTKAAAAAEKARSFLSGSAKGSTGAWGKSSKTLGSALSSISKSRSLKEQRQAFESLSNTLRDALKEFKHSSATPVNEFFCPMAFKNKGAFWLQSGDRTQNPYFGASMLRCGAKKNSYPASTAKAEEAPAGGHHHE